MHISKRRPAFRSKHAKHYYRILAGLDCVGNDPDSGGSRLILSGARSQTDRAAEDRR